MIRDIAHQISPYNPSGNSEEGNPVEEIRAGRAVGHTWQAVGDQYAGARCAAGPGWRGAGHLRTAVAAAPETPGKRQRRGLSRIREGLRAIRGRAAQRRGRSARPPAWETGSRWREVRLGVNG